MLKGLNVIHLLVISLNVQAKKGCLKKVKRTQLL